MKLLMLLSRVPWPVEKGDKLRAFHQLRCLSEEHEIHLFALTDRSDNREAEEKLSAYCKSITLYQTNYTTKAWNVVKAFFSGKPLQTGLFYSKGAKRELISLVKREQPDHLYCQLIRVAGLAEDIQIPSTVDYQDVMSVNMLRRKKASPLLMKPVMALEYRRLLKYEQRVFEQFDNHTIISLPDRNLMPCKKRDRIHVVPNGVDYNYFSPVDEPTDVDVVFIGNMGYPPNIDASEFLANEILPLLKKVIPGVRIMLAGANPHARVQNLEGKDVIVTGWVDDIRDCYSRSKVFVAPMRIGTGLQNKLLEAMAMKKPCVTTDLANSALGAKENIEILVSDNAKAIAGHIITLLTDTEKAKSIAENGYNFVHRNFSWEETALQLSEIMLSSHKK
ncbi:MAG: hypothetical protein C0593_01680 [Marinilabiliales bacterium]|nr:MAG: hypothetical protein C0593_01680 [Marinilabiliales bacterium]